MNKTYEVIFADNARPGVFAVGGIRRGQSGQVSAAEAVHLVDTKGLAFANPADEAAARRELNPSTSVAPAADDSNEEQ
jgi:hypothetical protein